MNRRKRMLNDLDQDIRDHIEVETRENITRGMSPEEARYAALRKSGNGTRVKEETREVTGKREGLPTNRDLPDCWIRGSTILMTDAYAGPCFGSWIFQPRMRSQNIRNISPKNVMKRNCRCAFG